MPEIRDAYDIIAALKVQTDRLEEMKREHSQIRDELSRLSSEQHERVRRCQAEAVALLEFNGVQECTCNGRVYLLREHPDSRPTKWVVIREQQRILNASSLKMPVDSPWAPAEESAVPA
ncbi:hypothetical protein P12x_003028 [Tundrisphaera lichenicola]|uniref:hypothetical protein n=1 Tax=Tundrisphaera lichenicola TaxID=2029860 RepID=UPI003EBE9745